MAKTKLQPSLLEGVYGGDKLFAVEYFDKTKPYSFTRTRNDLSLLFNHQDKSQVLEILKARHFVIRVEEVDLANIEKCFDWPEFLDFAAKKHNINNLVN